MKLPSEEQDWKQLIDRFLMIDLFLVIASSFLFVAAVILSSFGINSLIIIFQFLWQPLFIPAITILIAASLLNGLFSLLQQRAPFSDSDK